MFLHPGIPEYLMNPVRTGNPNLNVLSIILSHLKVPSSTDTMYRECG